MTIYFVDSSALVKRYISEIGSGWVLNLFDRTVRSASLVSASKERTPGRTTNLSDRCQSTGHDRRVWYLKILTAIRNIDRRRTRKFPG